MAHDPMVLPANLPRPVDDGAADHLTGSSVPSVELPATSGELIDLNAASAGRRLVIFAYPRTGRPDEDLPTADWDAIPGARGCTPEACSFRDLHTEMQAAGADVAGLSTQVTTDQKETAHRLHVPYPLLSDYRLELTRALALPTLEVAGLVMLRRLTMVLRDGLVEHVWYPVFPPDTHATEVVTWLQLRH